MDEILPSDRSIIPSPKLRPLRKGRGSYMVILGLQALEVGKPLGWKVSLPEISTAAVHTLKMDVWNMIFLFWAYLCLFSGANFLPCCAVDFFGVRF